jgi:hypothetical protein
MKRWNVPQYSISFLVSQRGEFDPKSFRMMGFHILLATSKKCTSLTHVMFAKHLVGEALFHNLPVMLRLLILVNEA